MSYQLVGMNGIMIQEGTLGPIQEESVQLDIPNGLVDGIYVLKIQGNRTDYVSKLFISR